MQLLGSIKNSLKSIYKLNNTQSSLNSNINELSRDNKAIQLAHFIASKNIFNQIIRFPYNQDFSKR